MRRLLGRLLLLILGTGLALAGAELALRLAPAGSRLATESSPPIVESPPDPPAGARRRVRSPSSWLLEDDPDPLIAKHLVPNMKTEHRGVWVVTSSLGFRGPELREGTTRVVGIGDSTMFGWGVTEPDTYLRRMEGDLRSTDPSIEVVNLAVPTYQPIQEVALLERHLDRLTPRVVIVGQNENDLRAPGGMRARPFIERHSYLYRLVRLRLEGVLPPPATWKDAILHAYRHLGDLARARGFTVVVLIYGGDVSKESNASALPSPEIRAVCREQGFLVAEHYTMLLDACKSGEIQTSRDTWLNAVGRVDPHPNASGHEIIERGLLPVVRQALKARSSA